MPRVPQRDHGERDGEGGLDLWRLRPQTAREVKFSHRQNPMAGRPPIPITRHKQRGTYRKDRHAGKFQASAGEIGPPPGWMAGDALVEWNRLVTHREYKQVIGATHRSALEEYCVLYGRMIEDAKGTAEMSATQRQVLHGLRMQLGLTPASQGKIRQPDKKADDNPWAEFATNG